MPKLSSDGWFRRVSAGCCSNAASGFGKLIGNGPAIWLRLQAAYDAWRAE
jgi:plasmid maintenance system antidote protein VapI